MTAYLAAVEWGGHGWRVRVGDVDLWARDLADVEPRCRRAIAESCGTVGDDIEVAVEVFVPAATQVRLELIAQLCEDIAEEWDAAHAELIGLGASLMDAARLLMGRYRPPRPLTVPSRELALAGLDAHPEAVGVWWSDHGHFVTVKCRRHIDATRHHYKDVAPDDECALIYDPAHMHCDLCLEHGEAATTSGAA